MNVTEDMIEILIGKHVDGEITASEQKLLDGAMEKDEAVRRLLEQMIELNEAGREAVGCEIFEKGKAPDEIINLALGRCSPARRRILTGGILRLTVGLAAGLVMGFALHHVLSLHKPTNGQTEQQITADIPGDSALDNITRIQPQLPQDVIRNVDYYGFTDADGEKWLIEGLRQNIVRPAVYSGDL
ncbi:MAG: hypothetical protein JW720_13715 [Sedimentisphaerales bacterium]|nr:hypothetical protein [Sedimentisphaerales bacterium]